MRNSLRLSVGALLLATAAACSRSADRPAMSDDLREDLAKIGTAQPKVEFVSAIERGESAVPAPRAKAIAKAPSANRGARAAVKSVHQDTPAPAQTSVQADEVAPAAVPKAEPAPEPVQSQARPRAPMPSTQQEPRGGWKTPAQIIRNAPFPINP